MTKNDNTLILRTSGKKHEVPGVHSHLIFQSTGTNAASVVEVFSDGDATLQINLPPTTQGDTCKIRINFKKERHGLFLVLKTAVADGWYVSWELE